MQKFVALALFSVLAVQDVLGHGRLIEPPSRSSLWRYGFVQAQLNFNDNELFCGGFNRQYFQNGGKCGICGDSWDEKPPRLHEDGGFFGQGIIARNFTQGDPMTIKVDITAHHMGYFEFKLCPRIDAKNVVINPQPDQECLDKYPLEIREADAKEKTRYHLPKGSTVGIYTVHTTLPKNLTCNQCVLQWHYYTGNSWGICPDGSGKMGCGNQEVFRGCSDIAIRPKH